MQKIAESDLEEFGEILDAISEDSKYILLVQNHEKHCNGKFSFWQRDNKTRTIEPFTLLTRADRQVSVYKPMNYVQIDCI